MGGMVVFLAIHQRLLVLTIVLHGCGGVPGYPREAVGTITLTIVLHGCSGVPGYPPEAGELLVSP